MRAITWLQRFLMQYFVVKTAQRILHLSTCGLLYKLVSKAAMLLLTGFSCNFKQKGTKYVVSHHTPRKMVGTLFLKEFLTVLDSSKTK